MYKIMGPRQRTIGGTDGEALHQSVSDRRNLPVCNYAPSNLLAAEAALNSPFGPC